jgi:hypothetical protein
LHSFGIANFHFLSFLFPFKVYLDLALRENTRVTDPASAEASPSADPATVTSTVTKKTPVVSSYNLRVRGHRIRKLEGKEPNELTPLLNKVRLC